MRYVYYVAFALYLVFSAVLYHQLPDRIAAHFDAAGVANGWASKWEYLFMMAAIPAAVMLVFIGIDFLCGIIPASMFNVPNAWYWQRAENQPRMRQLTSRFCWELGLYTIGFLSLIHLSILRANRLKPPRLDGSEYVAIAFFGVLTVWWLIRLFLIYRVPKGVTRESLEAKDADISTDTPD